MNGHTAVTTDEEYELALALALSASLEEQTRTGGASTHKPSAVPPVAASTVPDLGNNGASTRWPARSSAAHTHKPANHPGPEKQPTPTSNPAHTTVSTNPWACGGCGRTVFANCITALDKRWHPHCFVCGFCHEAIIPDGNPIGVEDGKPYHWDCHKHKLDIFCTVCGTYIKERSQGRIEYKENPFWKEKYCPQHWNDGTPQCCSCSRFQKQGEEWVQLQDKRCLCLTCLSTMVVDTQDCQPLYKDVLAFYRRMKMTHAQSVPLLLVDGPTLNEYSQREQPGRGDGPVFHVRGLTMYNVYSSIPSIFRTGSGRLADVHHVGVPVLNAAHCKVTGILVMYGLPRLLTGAILAHELMHAWLKMAGAAELSAQVEEGICQLMALLWLDSQSDDSQQDRNASKLHSYFAHQIRTDPSDIYGEGFRIAYESFQQYGLERVISHVLMTGQLP